MYERRDLVIVYHGTSSVFLPSINREGLHGSRESYLDRVYVVHRKELATAYGYVAAELEGGLPVVITINTNKTLVRDPEHEEERSYYIRGRIELSEIVAAETIRQ